MLATNDFGRTMGAMGTVDSPECPPLEVHLTHVGGGEVASRLFCGRCGRCALTGSNSNVLEEPTGADIGLCELDPTMAEQINLTADQLVA